MTENYLFKNFKNNKSYKIKLIKAVKKMCNMEIGGDKFYDGSALTICKTLKKLLN